MTAVMALGLFVFSVPTLTYEQFRRRSDYRFARNGRLGARDAAQFVGPGDQTVSLDGKAHAELSDGEASLDTLHAMAAEGEAQALVCANGRVYGNFVVTGIDERHILFAPDGTSLAIEFGIDLLRVDDTPPDSAAADAGTNIGAVASGAIGEAPASKVGGAVGDVASLASGAASKAATLAATLNSLSQPIAALNRVMDGLSVSRLSSLAGVKATVLSLTAGASATLAQAGAFAALGLDAASVAGRMGTDPAGAILQVMDGLGRLPAADRSGLIGDLFGEGAAPAIATLADNPGALRAGLKALS